MHSLARYILRYACVLLIVGFVNLGIAVYHLWKAVDGNAYKPREQLISLSFHVNSAQHVYEKVTRSLPQRLVDGRRYTTRPLYQLEVSNGTQARVYKLSRMNNPFPFQENNPYPFQDLTDILVGKNINVLVDADNHALVYEVTMLDEDGNEHLLQPYENGKNLLQVKAESKARNPIFWFHGLLLTAVGLFGLQLRRKRRLEQEGMA